MRTTIFSVDGESASEPRLAPLETYDDEPLDRVTSVDLPEVAAARMQLVEIAAGGSFAMHASPDVAFCQIVRGKGKLGLPGGRELAYEGPELYIFLPNALHDWHDVTEDTLLSVCIVSA